MSRFLRNRKVFQLVSGIALAIVLINKTWTLDQFNTLLQGIWLASLGYSFVLGRGKK